MEIETGLTKLDLAALRQGDDICVHLTDKYPEGRVRVIKRKRITENDPFATDLEHALTAKVQLHYPHKLQNGARCFAMMGIYHSGKGHISAVINTLRAGDEITFLFWPDAHSNPYMAMHGLHGDLLQLQVQRKGKTIAYWEMETTICANNSARMCADFPITDSYLADAKRARETV